MTQIFDDYRAAKTATGDELIALAEKYHSRLLSSSAISDGRQRAHLLRELRKEFMRDAPTYRDQLAEKVLLVILETSEGYEINGREAAQSAYIMADAMLEARQ